MGRIYTTARQEVETQHSAFSLRSITDRFGFPHFKSREKLQNSDPQLTNELFPGLPFDIQLTDEGFTLERISPCPEEDTGIRVFIVDSQHLSRFYESDHHSPEQIYEYLKKSDIGGRKLAQGNTPIHIDKEATPRWTLIVKQIDHIHKNHWRTPDLERLSFSPQLADKKHRGFTIVPILTERIYTITEDDQISLTQLSLTSPLHIAEPWISTLSAQELTDFEQTLSAKKVPDEKRDAMIDEKDRQLELYKPNVNTLIIESLRSHIGPIAAPPVEAYIVCDVKSGQLAIQIHRSPGLHDRLQSLSQNDEEYKTIVNGLPRSMTLETIANSSYGVNGIEFNGQMHMFHGESVLTVPIPISPNGANNVTLYFNAQSDARRTALSLDLSRINGQVMARVTRTIEPGELTELGSLKSRTIFSHEQELQKQLITKQSETPVLSPEMQKKQIELAEKHRKQILQRQQSPFVFSPTPPKALDI